MRFQPFACANVPALIQLARKRSSPDHNFATSMKRAVAILIDACRRSCPNCEVECKIVRVEALPATAMLRAPVGGLFVVQRSDADPDAHRWFATGGFLVSIH
jgi:hypothetical protein